MSENDADDDIDFDAAPPPDSGALQFDQALDISSTPTTPAASHSVGGGFWQPPWQAPLWLPIAEQMRWYEKFRPRIVGRIKAKNYFAYCKIQYHARTENAFGESITVSRIKLIMNSGQGKFVKEKSNTSEVKKLEEKYAASLSGTSEIFMRIEVEWNMITLVAQGVLKL